MINTENKTKEDIIFANITADIDNDSVLIKFFPKGKGKEALLDATVTTANGSKQSFNGVVGYEFFKEVEKNTSKVMLDVLDAMHKKYYRPVEDKRTTTTTEEQLQQRIDELEKQLKNIKNANSKQITYTKAEEKEIFDLCNTIVNNMKLFNLI